MVTQNTATADASRGSQWRWDMAGKIVRGEISADLVDAEIARAVVLRRHLDKQPPANAEPPGAEPCPFLITAHRIFHENGVARWQLEAYVLSDMSDREVAVRCDVPREVVAAYVAVFFDVRPHLPPGKWIMQHVIGPSPYSGFREHDVRPFWALMATLCGPKFVEMFVKAYLAALRPDDRPVLSVYFRPNVPLAVQGPVALQILGMTGEGDLVNEKLHRRLDVAESLADPELAEAEAKRAVGDVIQTARAILAGKRIPKQGKSARNRGRKHGREQRPDRKHEPFTNGGRNLLPILFVPD